VIPTEWWPIANWSTDTWLAIFTGLLVLVGLLQSWVFRHQAYWLRRTVEDAAKSDEVLQRAYLWPGLGIWRTLSPTQTEFVITIHNTGRTAGTLLRVHVAICDEASYPPALPVFTTFDREDVIPPEMAAGAMKDTGARCVLTGAAPQIIFGYAEYTDIFKKTRRCPWKHRVYLDGRSEPLEGCYSEWT
jgi:hypothetical protein